MIRFKVKFTLFMVLQSHRKLIELINVSLKARMFVYLVLHGGGNRKTRENHHCSPTLDGRPRFKVVYNLQSFPIEDNLRG